MNKEATSLNQRAGGLSGQAMIRPMSYPNVPAVDAHYWTAITLASIFGCNLGDCLSFYAGWNHWIGLAPLAFLFAALLFAERRSARATVAWYWSVVIVLRAAATNLADLATHTFEWPYPRVILGLTILQALVVWPVLPRLIRDGKDRVGRPATTGWYWLSLLTAGTLGTAIGDWAADELHLGTGYGTLVLGAIFAVVLALGSRSRWTTKAAYWLAIIAVRAAGTTAGDWLAFRDDPGLSNGLKLGLPLSTAFTCALFVGTLLLSKTSRLGDDSDPTNTSANPQNQALRSIPEEPSMPSNLFHLMPAPLLAHLNSLSILCSRMFRFIAMLCVAFSLPHRMVAQTSTGTLIAVNQADADISIVDPQAAKEVARVPEGAVAGHEVATSLDGNIAYVPIYGDSSVGEAGTDGRQMLAIDLASRKIVGRMDFGHGVRPHSIIMNPVDGLLYVTTELDRTVTVVNPKTLKIIGAIPTGQDQSHMLVISHDGRFGYTANVAPGTVSVLDLKARRLVCVIKVSGEVQRISIAPDDREVFTADQTQPRLAVIDTATNTVKHWIPLPALAYGTASTHDGRWLLVSLPDSYKVAVVDLKTLQVFRTISVPRGPHTVLMSPDNETAYVSCMKSGNIAVIHLPDWSVKQLIKVGNNADGIGWASSYQGN